MGYIFPNGGGVGGGGGAWGSITGTLADQTDLQTELDDKVSQVPNVADQTARLALTGIAKFTIVQQTDDNSVWVFIGTDPSDPSDWIQLGGGGGAPAQSTALHSGTTHLVTSADDRKVFVLHGGTIQLPASMSGYPDGFEITIVTTTAGGSVLLRAGDYYGAQGVVGTQIGNSYGSDTTLSTNQAGMLRLAWSTALNSWVFVDGRGVAWS